MRVVVTGSRDWREIDLIVRELMELPEQTRIAQGCASGADAIARSWTIKLGHIPEDFWPDYAAGLSFADANKIRNLEMVRPGADLGLAFPTKRSRGTWHCVTAMSRADIPVKIINEDGSHRWIPVEEL